MSNDALTGLEKALANEREALLGQDANALLQSTEAKLVAIKQLENLSPDANTIERIQQLALLNQANGTLLARRRRAVNWSLRQLGRQESGPYNARGQTATTTVSRGAIAVA